MARQEVVLAVRVRYQQATGPDQKRILGEFVAVTGYHRKHAIRVLARSCGDSKAERHRPPEQTERYWRTREDPFEAVWPTILEWLEAAPESSAKGLLGRFIPRRAVTNPATPGQRMAKC